MSDQVFNRHRVLKAIQRQGPISRTELTETTGLSGALITEVTADLIKRGLVLTQRVENGPARGRPRTQLRINPQGGLVVGAALRTSHCVEVYFVDLAGNLLRSHSTPLTPLRSLSEFAATIARILDDAIVASQFTHAEVCRIAIALPGLIDSVRGMVHWLTTFDEPPFPFADAVASRLGIPVTIEDDATCLARAEHWFGEAQRLDNFSLFHVGAWIDAAQYYEGMPRVGGNGFNSEIAHVKTDHGPTARPCVCGAKGCLGLYGTVFGIAINAGISPGFEAEDPFDFLSRYDDLAAAAERGDAQAMRAFETAGHHLGIAIADHINVFDPADVLVLMKDAPLLALTRPALERTIAGNVFRPIRNRTNVRLGLIDDEWRWKGVAAHALEQTYLGEP